MVDSELAAPSVFRSGATAERKAKELGKLAALEDQTQVLVHDRTGQIVGSTVLGAGRS